MYWLWGVAENAELMNWRPRRFWGRLQRLCARKHGYGLKDETGDDAGCDTNIFPGNIHDGEIRNVFFSYLLDLAPTAIGNTQSCWLHNCYNTACHEVWFGENKIELCRGHLMEYARLTNVPWVQKFYNEQPDKDL